MYISLIIKHNKQSKESPITYIFESNYAIEQMLIKLSEIYFGKIVSLKIEDLLKERINGG